MPLGKFDDGKWEVYLESLIRCAFPRERWAKNIRVHVSSSPAPVANSHASFGNGEKGDTYLTISQGMISLLEKRDEFVFLMTHLVGHLRSGDELPRQSFWADIGIKPKKNFADLEWRLHERADEFALETLTQSNPSWDVCAAFTSADKITKVSGLEGDFRRTEMMNARRERLRGFCEEYGGKKPR
jgi:hypothetical protein